MTVTFAGLGLLIAIVVFAAIAALLVVVTVALTARRSHVGPSNPDVAPCPSCGALVPLAKTNCPSCGARVA